MVDTALPGDIGCLVIGESGIAIEGSACPPDVQPPLLKTIPSYLYWEYQDDDDLQAFVAAYNTLAQLFIDWYVGLNLPIYTGGVVYGLLLDWVAAGLYGLLRPVLGEGQYRSIGPYDTYAYDTLAFDGTEVLSKVSFLPTTDDVFRRIITWNFLKGEGKHFTVRWLKRRIMQFLLGPDGIPIDVDQTYRVSVSFGLDGQLNITLLQWLSVLGETSCFDTHMFDSEPFDFITVPRIHEFDPMFEFAQVFRYAVDSGVLDMPFQFTPFIVIQQ